MDLQIPSQVIFPPLPGNPRTMANHKEISKLDSLAHDSDVVIYDMSAVFPFQLFPDRLVIDLNKITLIRNELLYKRIISILIEDVLTFKVTRDIFFASISVEIRGFEQNPRPITFLKPNQAQAAEIYVLGIMKAKKESIDLSKVPTGILRKKLKEIRLVKTSS